jgi:hypothetical protein
MQQNQEDKIFELIIVDLKCLQLKITYIILTFGNYTFIDSHI